MDYRVFRANTTISTSQANYDKIHNSINLYRIQVSARAGAVQNGNIVSDSLCFIIEYINT